MGSICLYLVPVILPYPSISIHIHPYPSISIHLHPSPSISIHLHHSIINESTTSAKLDQGDQSQCPELGTDEGSESPLVQRCGNATIQHRNMVRRTWNTKCCPRAGRHARSCLAPSSSCSCRRESWRACLKKIKLIRISGVRHGQTKPNPTPTLSYWSPTMTQVEGILTILEYIRIT